jgi:2-polyprenyl-3-methyl-5-hydroxy-6-metoxy-1,4-benzoquinol methylase
VAASVNTICPGCDGSGFHFFSDLHGWTLVSSDARPFKAEVELVQCEQCGQIYKVPTNAWQDITDEIYRTYEIYHQSGGVEQKVRNEHAGGLVSRSSVLVRRLAGYCSLAESGSILDFGCGNGAFLSAVHAVRPGWHLAGSDINIKFKESIESISDNAVFIQGGLDEIEEKYDVISLVHCIEHLDDPKHYVRELAKKLKPSGIMFFQCPNIHANPFDLLIIDHVSHFTPGHLADMVEKAGLGPVALLSALDEKENSLVAGPGVTGRPHDKISDVDLLERQTSVLEHVFAFYDGLAPGIEKVGIFGTSIAATWLVNSARRKPDFFVDEDPSRIGREYYGRTIIGPENVPRDAKVFVPLAPGVAREVSKRLGPDRYLYAA